MSRALGKVLYRACTTVCAHGATQAVELMLVFSKQRRNGGNLVWQLSFAQTVGLIGCCYSQSHRCCILYILLCSVGS